ncbi:MFS transporter [Aeromicrobium sp. CnD17-E]|uniref:MFS transporter n=1 Tax=Aeromicrobium sp. CnD17-E TaxID=2954487 RepID=UPI0020979E09|nr:MFS transporter [Aeromicrobium sp. CnD17-E]MCO7239850.1 MFS transporter [Aeromicrobium sp. CnD17-E]
MSTTLTPPAVDAPTAVPRSRRALALALVAASLPMFMATLDNLVMTSALPVVQADLGATDTQLSWFMNAYTLPFATFMLALATFGDRVGRRRVMIGGIGVFTLGSVAAALSGSAEALVAARALQGIGAAAIVPLSLTLLAAAVPPSARAAAIGVWSGVAGLGVAVGPVVGGAVVEGLSWQAIFWINVPVAVVAVPLLLAATPESRSALPGRLDVVGTLLLGGAVLAGVWGIVHGNDDGWSSAGVLGPLVAAGLMLAAYVGWARRLDRAGRLDADAVLPVRLFRRRAFGAANVVGLLFSLGMFGSVFLLSQYLQVVQGYSPLEAGVRTLPWTAAPMVVAPLAGALVPRLGARALLVAGLALQTGSLLWFAAVVEQWDGYGGLVAPLVLAGIGMGLTFAPMSTAVLDGLPGDDLAVASSANNTIREFGVALGIAVIVAVFQGFGGTISPDGYAGAVGPALVAAAAAVAVALAAAFLVPARAGRSATVD